MLEAHGFQAVIVCDGKELETYAPNVEGRTISGWVASEVGKEFGITIRQSTPGRHPRTRQVLFVDGAEINRMIPLDPDDFTHEGIRPTPTTFAPFQFAPLRITDNAALSAPNGNDDGLGTIKVVIDRRRVQDAGSTVYDKFEELPQAVVHERNKKRVLGGHSVSTGKVREMSPDLTVSTRPYKKRDPVPYVAFVFKYRSRDFLVAQDIIPVTRPATGVAIGEKRSHDAAQGEDGTPEDARPAKRICVEEHDEARRRLRALKDEMRNIEARLADDLGQPAPNVKREPFPFAVGAVVDLTADDEPGTSRHAVKREMPSEIEVGAAAGTVIDLTDD